MLGYFLVIVFAILFIISPFRGRWFCGNLCPRGSFNDFWLSKISWNKRIPGFFRSLWLRIPLIALMMGFIFYRIIATVGVVEKIGMIFVSMCLITTAIAVLSGVFINPRSWCTFCPMGTVQRTLGGAKYQLQVAKKLCIDCGVCHNACPMQLPVNEIINKPDCIKCGRCITACPKNALTF